MSDETTEETPDKVPPGQVDNPGKAVGKSTAPGQVKKQPAPNQDLPDDPSANQ